MADPNTRSQPVNVDEIMQRIRARIREKRGADQTEQQIRELAAAKLAGFLDPQHASSGLLDKLRHGATSPLEPSAFDDSLLYGRRAPLRWIRRLLSPILRLLLSPSAWIHALRLQGDINTRLGQFDQLSYELLENLVLETTRLEIEVKKLEMQLESQSSRFDFAERRARTLEGVVRYRSEQAADTEGVQVRTPREQAAPIQAGSPGQPVPGREADPAGSSDARRRRRRRRGRRGGTNRIAGENAQAGAEPTQGSDAATEPRDVEPVTDSGEGSTSGSQGPEPPAPSERDDQ
jgi:hypothetical protein